MFKLEERRARAKRLPNATPPPEQFPWELVTYVGGGIGLVVLLSAVIVYTVLRVYG